MGNSKDLSIRVKSVPKKDIFCCQIFVTTCHAISNLNKHMYACIYVYMYACLYVHMHAYLNVYM